VRNQGIDKAHLLIKKNPNSVQKGGKKILMKQEKEWVNKNRKGMGEKTKSGGGRKEGGKN